MIARRDLDGQSQPTLGPPVDELLAEAEEGIVSALTDAGSGRTASARLSRILACLSQPRVGKKRGWTLRFSTLPGVTATIERKFTLMRQRKRGRLALTRRPEFHVFGCAPRTNSVKGRR